jgi:hypothetical protein
VLRSAIADITQDYPGGRSQLVEHVRFRPIADIRTSSDNATPAYTTYTDWLTLQTCWRICNREVTMAGLTIHDVTRSERLRTVTDNFFFWQGQRFVPLGLATMIVALVMSRDHLDKRLTDGIILATIIGASIAVHVLGRNYGRTYGQVRPIPGAHSRRSLFKWLLVYPLMFASIAADLMIDWLPIMLSGIVWAAGVILYRNSTGGGRNHYFVLAASLASLSLAPIAANISVKDSVTLMMLVLGAAFSVSALLDDRELRSVLPGTSGK